MHSFGCLFVLCIPYTYSAAQVEFNASKRVYTVGDNVKLSCFIKTSWMAVSFYRNNTILIGDCLTFYNACRATNYTLTRHKQYILSMENSNPVLYIYNVTKEDSDVTFTGLWTSFRDSVSFHVQDPISATPYSSANEEIPNRTNNIGATVGIVLGALAFTGFVISMVYIHNRLRRCDASEQRNNGTPETSNDDYTIIRTDDIDEPSNIDDTKISIDGIPETPCFVAYEEDRMMTSQYGVILASHNDRSINKHIFTRKTNFNLSGVRYYKGYPTDDNLGYSVFFFLSFARKHLNKSASS